ncbi:MAG: inositol monophosphatase [Candidatus Muiribacterium halophilum]|uniref:Inositol-1-monophosphatase n=1 Tax=Muiribacterium halophilum TaxID=2053465 RepID=A0A2N5ZKZ4_MUIH1|nr:MAG: inositol monophosphatase [Candidatus Muirbacterium halophilum]
MKKILCDIAIEAGKIALEGYNGNFNTFYKGEVDPVTEYDKKVQEYIVKRLRTEFDNINIFAEEDDLQEDTDKMTAFIDPIDGTVNYAHRLPMFCSSIGIYNGKESIAGVVYIPVLDELFFAERGKGAFLNDKKIEVSNQENLKRSVFATGFPYDKHISKRNNIDNFSRMLKKIQGIRRMGAAAIDMCYVACGRLDGFWELKLKPWDYAAAAIIAKEAGAVVDSFNSREWDLFDDSIILGGEKTVKNMKEVLLYD